MPRHKLPRSVRQLGRVDVARAQRPVQHGRCDGVEEIGGKVPAGGFTVDLGDQEAAGSLRSHTEDAPLARRSSARQSNATN
jgi:hypothetical protein